MIKDVIVHLDGTGDDEWRIAHTEKVARVVEAHVTGLFLNRLVAGAIPIEAGYIGAEILERLLQQARDEGDRVERQLIDRMARLDLPHEICRIDAFSDEIPGAAAREARGADLCIVLRPYTPAGTQRWLGLAEGVLFGSGRAILVVPETRPARPAIEHVFVGWNESPEAAHAVAEAMPLIKQAREVTVVMVDPNTEANRHPGARLVRHFEHHGVKVRTRSVRSDGQRISQILIDEAERSGSDLMVAGAYGHARIREWVLGGVTRDLLHRATVPMLLAH